MATGRRYVRRYHRSMRRAFRSGGSVLLVATAFVAGWVRVPYYSLGPGPAREVVPLIHVEGAPTYASSGHLVMTTVRFTQLTPIGSLVAWIDPEQAVVGEQVVFPPGLTPAEEERRATAQMDRSKIDAAVVVLEEISGYPAEHGPGALIETVGEGCPADGRLFPGDLLVGVGGEMVDSSGEASRLIDRVPVDEPVDLRIEVGGQTRVVHLTRGRCPGVDEPLLGIGLVPAFPFEISIESGDVGGPSAGLMWAIGLYELLTPGDLARGRTIAGTGAIDDEGNVEPIGGILDKVVAARDANADVLLVPEGNAGELRGAPRGDLIVIPVATFDEAVAALEASEATG